MNRVFFPSHLGKGLTNFNAQVVFEPTSGLPILLHNGGHSLEFSRQVPGLSNEVSSQGVVTRNRLGSICRIDWPSALINMLLY